MFSDTVFGSSILSPVTSLTQPAQVHSERRYLLLNMLIWPSSQVTVVSVGPVFFNSTGNGADIFIPSISIDSPVFLLCPIIADLNISSQSLPRPGSLLIFNGN